MIFCVTGCSLFGIRNLNDLETCLIELTDEKEETLCDGIEQEKTLAEYFISFGFKFKSESTVYGGISATYSDEAWNIMIHIQAFGLSVDDLTESLARKYHDILYMIVDDIHKIGEDFIVDVDLTLVAADRAFTVGLGYLQSLDNMVSVGVFVLKEAVDDQIFIDLMERYLPLLEDINIELLAIQIGEFDSLHSTGVFINPDVMKYSLRIGTEHSISRNQIQSWLEGQLEDYSIIE